MIVCGRLANYSSISELDRIVLPLKCMSTQLGNLLRSSELEARELHVHPIVFGLETRLMFLLTSMKCIA